VNQIPSTQPGDTKPRDISIPARDGFALAASLFEPAQATGQVVVINAATGVPRRFYRHYAAALARAGMLAVTYDYRGIGDSRPRSLRGFDARVDDWVFKDMAGVVDWLAGQVKPDRLFLVGHSVGGQLAGLLDNAGAIAGMVTISAQSGHWRFQGAEQKWAVWLHAHISMPVLSHLLGYMPFSWFGAGEDIPKAAALQWARWCRDRNYLLGDEDLPLDRYQRFLAPVLAYSFEDDKWGTARSVDEMMEAYPNVERRHLKAGDAGLKSIGHLGYFRPQSGPLWSEAVEWLRGI
jgi:predicted alpha/beta hydrolase